MVAHALGALYYVCAGMPCFVLCLYRHAVLYAMFVHSLSAMYYVWTGMPCPVLCLYRHLMLCTLFVHAPSTLCYVSAGMPCFVLCLYRHAILCTMLVPVFLFFDMVVKKEKKSFVSLKLECQSGGRTHDLDFPSR